jgi:ornithine cyclodeaminase
MQTVTVAPHEIREAVTMRAAIDAVRGGFLDMAAGEFEMPARTVLRDGGFLVMSAHHRATASAMIKTLSLDFDRTPAIAGTVVWTETGRADSLVADAGTVTALRTGAAVGVATDLLAPAGAGRLTLIGAGGQALDQVRAVHTVRSLRETTVVDTDPRRAAALAETLAAELTGTQIHTASDAEDAVGGADIVCCATPATAPLFRERALPAEVHVNAIGAFRPTMRELPDDLLATGTVIVDDRAAVLEESGEIIHALQTGALTEGDLTELGTALAAPEAPRGKRTVFKTVGVAVQDWAVARLLADAFLP